MLQEGEIAALYRRYGHALYQRALTLLGHEGDAREVMQETFCQFLQSRFAQKSSPFTFLYRITTNLAIDLLRKRKTRGMNVPLENQMLTADPNVAEQTQAASVLLDITLGLDQETLVIAVLHHVDGLTQDEIALSMNLSRRTIGKRLKHFLSYTRERGANNDIKNFVVKEGVTHES